MLELPMIFAAGMLGTAHCVGMCGPFVLMIGGATDHWSTAFARQVAYTAGRVFTYGVLGAVAGYGGQRLVHAWPTIINLPALLAVSAGMLLTYQGLLAAGVLPKRAIGPGQTACLTGGILRHFLRSSGTTAAFLAGLFTGLLPCGLLYGMLALAMSTHSLLWGGTVMMVFGLGTAPAMIAVGVGGRLLGLATRRRLFAAAAWCLILTGALSIFRGISSISAGEGAASGCPLCSQ